MINIFGVEIELLQYVVLAISAVVIGISKTGLNGLGTVVVSILAIAYGSKPSTGLILPMLCFADLFGVIYYRRSVEWRHIVRLLPAAVVGMLLALAVDSIVPKEMFKLLLIGSVAIGVLMMLVRGEYVERLASNRLVAPLFGLLGGFTTMIGNAAGAVMTIYLLSMKLPKLSFIGTTAWFFLIVNYLKLPLQIFAWNNITIETLKLNLSVSPFIVIGAILGILFVKRLDEKRFRQVIIWLTLLSVLAMAVA